MVNMIMGMPNSFFFCYARLDQDFVLHLAEILKENGVSVWIDQWSIPVGADWNLEIDKAINQCTCFIIILSPASTASEDSGEVRGELRLALNLGKKILPIMHSECTIPRQLLDIETIDFTAGITNQGIERLIQIGSGKIPVSHPSNRLSFIEKLKTIPEDARAFDNEFSKSVSIELSKVLTDTQFAALCNLKAIHATPGEGYKGIVKSLALECIGGKSWESARTFDALVQLGFLADSADNRERSHFDPGYDYTPLFFGYTNLQQWLGFGQNLDQRGVLGPEYFLESRGAHKAG